MGLDSMKNKIKKLERELVADVRQRLISRTELLHPNGKYYSLLVNMKSRMVLYDMKFNLGMFRENENEESGVIDPSISEFEKRLLRISDVAEKRQNELKDCYLKEKTMDKEDIIILREKIESIKGNPTHFLFNVDPKIIYATLPDGKRNPYFEPDVLIENFTPVYADGSLGYPELYKVSDGSWTVYEDT